MGGSISSLFGVSEDESSEDYLQLTDLGGFLSKYIFIMLDKDKRKLVSKQEYLTLVNHFREQKTTEAELDNFLKRHVAEGQSTEYINERLFKRLIIQLAMDFDRNVSERMKYLMTLFDKDNDGFVSEMDLRQVYDAIGIQVPMEPIQSLIGKYDVDGDNKLSVEEFEQLGRSAMSKLFLRKEVVSPEDALVAEAIRKGSESVVSGRQQSNSDKLPAIEKQEKEEHLINNNYLPDKDITDDNDQHDARYMVVDDVVFGKPVVLKDSETTSSVIGQVNASTCKDGPLGETKLNNMYLSDFGDFGESCSKMEGVLSELQVEEEQTP